MLQMMPVYRHMDSSPHQRSQMHFPGAEAAPPQMVMYPSQSQVWPHGSGYGYSVPCPGCFNHGSFPGYHGFRPPNGYCVPAPAFNQCGSYPSFPEAYPMYYAPLHYSRELPRYEYDKDAAQRTHCCGCPSHPCHQKSDRGVKVEEQEPDVKKSEGNAVVPAQFRNYPFPIMWIPQGNKPAEPEIADWDKEHGDRKSPQVVKSPVNMTDQKSSVQREDGRKLQNKQDEERMEQFPFPIIWIPCEKEEEAENLDNRKVMPTSKPLEVAPTDSKFVPVKPTIGDVHTKEPETNEENHAKNDAGMATAMKQSEVQKMDKSEEAERRIKSVPVKQVEDGSMDKSSGPGTRRQSLSSPKSKLAPVCLRVDPLPKRKNGNGSSRSPSPPNSKGKTEETVKENSKPSVEQGLNAYSTEEKQPEDRSPSKINKVLPTKKQIKNIKVIEKRSKDENAEITASKPVASQEGGSWKPAGETGHVSAECRNGEVVRHEETAGPETALVRKQANAPSKSSCGESEAKEKQLTEAEAALLIQSAFRGYEVRKWEPLKKLKQIMKVREEVAEVGNQIQELESSSDPQKDDKQRLFIGEKIMSLLLKLDTIQGLHPSFRDLRKSLARELVMLQENLDSLPSKKTKEVVEESANSNLADALTDAYDSGENAKQPCEQLLSHAISNESPESTREETAEPVVLHNESDEKQDNAEYCQEANLQSSIELGGEKHGDNAPAMVEDVPPTLQQSVDHSLVPDNKSSFGHSMVPKEIRVETIEKEKIQEAGVHDVVQKQIGDEVKETEHGAVESESTISSDVLSRIENSIPTEEDIISVAEGELPVGVIEDVPVGVIEDEAAIPQPGVCAEPEMTKVEVSPGTEGENNVTKNTAPSIDEVSIVNESEEQLQEADSSEWIKVQLEQPQEDYTSDEFTVVNASGEENTCNAVGVDGDFREIPVYGSCSSEPEDENALIKVKEMVFEEKREDSVQDQAMITNDITWEETKGSEAPELASESVEVEVPAEAHVTSVSSEEAKQLLTRSPVSPKEEDEAVMETDTKLLEENKQLREMMNKLMEAGTQQLNVISNLTGRVKDLERKLSLKRKTKKPGYRKPKRAASRNITTIPSSSLPC